MLAKGLIEEFFFAGGQGMKITLDNEATAEVAEAHDPKHTTRVRIQDDANKLYADTLIYITDTTYINGLHRIVAKETNYFDIACKSFTVETTSSAYAWPGVTFDEPWELIGFELHLDGAVDATESLVITKDDARGSKWDTILYTRAMNGIIDLIYYYPKPLQMQGDDVAFFTWANADPQVYGLSAYARRMA